MLYVLVCGYLPFDGHNFSELFNKILKLQYTIPSYVSPGKLRVVDCPSFTDCLECSSLLKRMLVVDPASRATIDEIRQHPWLSSVSKYLNSSVAQDITDLSKIDKEIVAEMEGFGFNIEEIVQALLNNCYNDAAATYFLLEYAHSKRKANKKKSVSVKTPAEGTGANVAPAITVSAPKDSTPQPTGKEKRFKKGHRRLHTVDACEQSGSGTSRKVAETPPESPATSPRLISVASAPKRTGHANTLSGGDRIDTPEKEKRGGFNVKTILKTSGKHRRTSSEVTSNEMLRHTPDPSELLRHRDRDTPVVSTVRPHTDPRRHEDRKINPDVVVFDDSPHSETGAVGTSSSNSNPTTPRSVENEEDWVVVEEDAEAPISRSPGRSAMSSIISSFKSMWKKHPHKEGDKPPQPRVVRFAFSVNTTSDRQPDAIMREVQTVLQHFHIPFTMKSPFYADCVVDGVRFSVEVCRLPRLVVNGIRLARISGSAWNYKKIVKDLVAHMNL